MIINRDLRTQGDCLIIGRKRLLLAFQHRKNPALLVPCRRIFRVGLNRLIKTVQRRIILMPPKMGIRIGKPHRRINRRRKG